MKWSKACAVISGVRSHAVRTVTVRGPDEGGRDPV